MFSKLTEEQKDIIERKFAAQWKANMSKAGLKPTLKKPTKPA